MITISVLLLFGIVCLSIATGFVRGYQMGFEAGISMMRKIQNESEEK